MPAAAGSPGPAAGPATRAAGADRGRARRDGGPGDAGADAPRGAGAERAGRPRREPGEGPHVIPGRHPVAEALRARRRLVEIVVEDRLAGELADVRNAANAAGVAARVAPREELDDLAGGVLHQGVVAVQRAFPYAPCPPWPPATSSSSWTG